MKGFEVTENDGVKFLFRCMQVDHWQGEDLEEMLDKDVIGALAFLSEQVLRWLLSEGLVAS